MKARLPDHAAVAGRPGRTSLPAALLLLCALVICGGCEYDYTSGPEELERKLHELQVASLYFTQDEVLEILADELEGRRIRFVLRGMEIRTGGLSDYEYGQTEFESVASSYLADVQDRLEAHGGPDSETMSLLSDRILTLLADEGAILGQVEAVLIPALFGVFEKPGGAGGSGDCNKVRLDDIGAVSVSIADVSLTREGAELALRFDLADLLIEVESARAWVPTLWCNVLTINEFDVSFPGTVLSVDLDAKPSHHTQAFSLPQIWAECRYISPQSLFYPDGLPEDPDLLPTGLDYANVTVSSSWRLGDLRSPELDFDNPVSDLVVGLVMGAGGLLRTAAEGVGCVFDSVFGDGSACGPDEAEAVALPEITYSLKYGHFAVQTIEEAASENGIWVKYMVDLDWDEVLTGLDNCPAVTNRAQTDSDFDGVGDACDPNVMSVSEAEMDAALEFFIDWAYIALCMGDIIRSDLPEYLGADELFSILDDPGVIGRFSEVDLMPGLLADLINGYLHRWYATYAGGSGPIMERPENYIDRRVAYDIARQQIVDLAGRLGRPGLLNLQLTTMMRADGVARLTIVDPAGVMHDLTAPEMILLRMAAPAIAVRPLSANGGFTSDSPLPTMRSDTVFLDAEPNPFNPRISLRFALPHEGAVEVAILDVRGRLVRRLVSGSLPAGDHEAVWIGDDDQGRQQPSGVYLALVRTETGRAVRKITMLQ